MTHLPSPSGGKLKTILRWRTDNFIQTLSYFPTLLLFKQERRGDNCKLYSFTICIFIWTDTDLGTLARWMPTCVLTPDQKAIGHPADMCTSAICCGYLTLNVRMSGVTSPLLRCFAPSDHLHFFSCGQSTVHPHRPPPLTRPRYPWTSFLSLLVSSSSPHYGETHNEIRKIIQVIFRKYL